jgi:hypothetical protein
MGCKVRIQQVERANSISFYVKFPAVFADAVSIKKSEEMEWFIEDRSQFILKRVKEVKSFSSKRKQALI